MAQPLPVWRTIQDAWERFVDNIRVVLFYVGIVVVVQWILASQGITSFSEPEDLDPVTGLLAFFLGLGLAWLALGMLRVAIDAVRREPIRYARLLTPAGDFLRIIGILLVVAIPVVLGMVFLLVPGIYLCLLWSQANFLILDRKAGVFSSLTQSGKMTKGTKLALLGIYLLLALFSLLPQIALAVFTEGSELFSAVSSQSAPVVLTRFVATLLVNFLGVFNIFVGAMAYIRLLERTGEPPAAAPRFAGVSPDGVILPTPPQP